MSGRTRPEAELERRGRIRPEMNAELGGIA